MKWNEEQKSTWNERKGSEKVSEWEKFGYFSVLCSLSLTPRFLSLLLLFFFFWVLVLFFRVFIRVWLWWRRGASVKCEREFGFNWEYLYYWAALQTFWTLFRAHLSIHNIHIGVKLKLPSFFFFFFFDKVHTVWLQLLPYLQKF